MDSLKLGLTLQFLLGNSSRKITQVSHAKQGLIYVCGCYIVFYSPFVDQQVAYIKHNNQNISAISVSKDQNLLAVAQSGKNPLIYVYSIQKALSLGNNEQQKPQYILKGHKQSIDLLKFSPNCKYLVSVCNSDGSMFIWEKGESISKNKLSKPVNVLLFDWNQDLLTVGNGYIKLWKFENGNILRKKEGQYWMIQGKLVNLGKNFTTKNYIDCVVFQNKEQPNNEKLILLSSQGFLGTVSHSYDKVQKWVDLMMQNTKSLQIYENLALCAGNNALIKIIDLVSLSLRGKFPKPPPLNKQNITKDQQLQIKEDEKFPACIGVLIFSNFILTLYENATMFIWTMEQEIKALRSIITHRQKINCISLLEQIHGDIAFFATAAEDNTLRIWHFYTKCYEQNRQSLDIAQIIGIKRNAYCKNLTRIIYTDSEYPIIQVKAYMKKYIVCISKRQFLMYSLQTFGLALYENFSNEYKSVSFKNPDIVLSIEVSEDLIYLGFQNGFLKIYKASQKNLLKLKEIDFGDPVQGLSLSGNKKIVVQCRNKSILYDFENNMKNNFNGVITSCSTDKHLFLGEERKVIYYGISKNRKSAQLSLLHEFNPDEKIKKLTSNQNLLIIVSTKDRLIIANFSATIIYSEQMNQQITDVAITKTGHIIFTGREGNIIIKDIAESKYKKIEQNAKKWFEINDMSWMDNSIWASKQMNSHSNIRNRLTENSAARVNQSQTLLGGIQRARSVNLDNILGDQSIQGAQMPSVQYKYKNQQNKMSIFNPSSIYRQANKIYANVNGLMKNFTGKGNEQKSNNINFSGQIDDDVFKSQNSAAQGRKDKILEDESHHYPRFTNNLVESQMAQIKEDEQSRILNDKKGDSKMPQSQIGRSKSSSPNYSRGQKPGQTLVYSTQLGQFKQGNVNNSLKISQNIKPQDFKKQDELVHTFKQIIQASQYGPQNIDHVYLKSLIDQNSEDFRKIYFVLNRIYGNNDKTELQTQKETQASVLGKQAIIQEYKRVTQGYLKFLQNQL